LESYNILIVEDEFLNAEFIEQVVEQLGHNVVGNVDNAQEAIAIAKTQNIDLALMDINLEGEIDGIQCSILLNHKQDVPTIYITAFGDSATISEAADTNIYGYIIKPFNENDIEAVLAVAIAKLKKQQSQSSHTPPPQYTIDLGKGYSYRLDKKSLLKASNQELVKLSNRLSNLLYIFCLHLDQVVSQELLIEQVWEGKAVSDSTVRDTILRLRKELPVLKIESLSGVGYSLKSPKDE